jgi:predicted metal-dependent hydrolase
MPTSWVDQDDPRIHYRISERARRISIKVLSAERRVEVVVPHMGRGGRRAVGEAESFARKQADWINVQLEHLPPPMPFKPGAQIMIRGELYGLGNPGGRARPKIDHAGRRVIVPAPAGAFAGRVKRLLIREAREALEAATHHYADVIDKRVAKVSVRDTASRWGSSITRGDQTHINYSWRLMCAPEFVLDYVAAHEVAHILQPNHSSDFWDLCEEIYGTDSGGDMRKAKRWLKQHGPKLHAVGAEV